MKLIDEDPSDGGCLHAIKSGLTVLSVGGMALQKCNALGIADLGEFAISNVPCLVISDLNDPVEMTAAAKAGFRGFISTDMDPELAFRTLTFILGNGISFPREAIVEDKIRIQPDLSCTEDIPGSLTGLTPRQQEVLECLCKGRSNKLIGRYLDLQESTVKVHVRQIMRKFGAVNRTQLALLAERSVNGHTTLE
ncbi:response regulator transcription factor [Rhodobacter sp. 24-YEA-8]|uniref:response regulator transcription factor n=1 Tax=Rhodobacter sp. 24-YEA-8 TaxID=1884310 RepID=UPI00209B819E|nr:response regulator transcription factor [Rhodobacter sp. 24-YEA-8]